MSLSHVVDLPKSRIGKFSDLQPADQAGVIRLVKDTANMNSMQIQEAWSELVAGLVGQVEENPLCARSVKNPVIMRGIMASAYTAQLKKHSTSKKKKR